MTFKNKADLEQLLTKIITSLVTETAKNEIPIHTIGERFSKQYEKGITKVLKELDIDGNFLNFLQSCSAFELKKTGNAWQIALQ